ncbi:DUF92 domain-containing protein [Segetibacter aerophilus]|uniref:DUF92 domain-containing protein n=1 Tax=Segetibacter aerophilus TaxID=670293 RepID=A0A512B839_9BACT|nr:DUF92 domain-containing protein [Segetibacter aerophilus]GEO08126.1 hypothetical protein SAE01_06220 [Segetibacter aerophilus]
MLSSYFIIVTILAVIAVASVLVKKLTMPAGITGFIVGLLIFAGAGYTGVIMLAVFFLLGTSATSWGMRQKQRMGLAESDKGQRTAGQVIANGGVAALLGLLSFALPALSSLFTLMIAASLASATADTLSSELGNLYGKKFYNVITLQKDRRGLDGVISFEGTILGVLGALCIALVFSVGFGFSINFLLIIIAGTTGNLFDSVLGATLERRHTLNNNAVNFLNTAIAAIAIYILYFLTNIS